MHPAKLMFTHAFVLILEHEITAPFSIFSVMPKLLFYINTMVVKIQAVLYDVFLFCVVRLLVRQPSTATTSRVALPLFVFVLAFRLVLEEPPLHNTNRADGAAVASPPAYAAARVPSSAGGFDRYMIIPKPIPKRSSTSLLLILSS